MLVHADVDFKKIVIRPTMARTRGFLRVPGAGTQWEMTGRRVEREAAARQPEDLPVLHGAVEDQELQRAAPFFTNQEIKDIKSRGKTKQITGVAHRRTLRCRAEIDRAIPGRFPDQAGDRVRDSLGDHIAPLQRPAARGRREQGGGVVKAGGAVLRALVRLDATVYKPEARQAIEALRLARNAALRTLKGNAAAQRALADLETARGAWLREHVEVQA